MHIHYIYLTIYTYLYKFLRPYRNFKPFSFSASIRCTCRPLRNWKAFFLSLANLNFLATLLSVPVNFYFPSLFCEIYLCPKNTKLSGFLLDTFLRCTCVCMRRSMCVCWRVYATVCATFSKNCFCISCCDWQARIDGLWIGLACDGLGRSLLRTKYENVGQ